MGGMRVKVGLCDMVLQPSSSSTNWLKFRPRKWEPREWRVWWNTFQSSCRIIPASDTMTKYCSTSLQVDVTIVWIHVIKPDHSDVNMFTSDIRADDVLWHGCNKISATQPSGHELVSSLSQPSSSLPGKVSVYRLVVSGKSCFWWKFGCETVSSLETCQQCCDGAAQTCFTGQIPEFLDILSPWQSPHQGGPL